MEQKKFVITKKIAKHGKQAIIVIPKILQQELKPDTIVKLTIDVLELKQEEAVAENSSPNTIIYRRAEE